MTQGFRLLVVLLLALVTAVAACRDEDTDLATAGFKTKRQARDASPGDTAAASNGPTAGGSASGTGVDVELVCPDGVEKDTKEWSGRAGLTQQEAVAEAFGDLIVGWLGEPFEIESTGTWSSWGLDDDAGNLVAVATVVVSSGGWDPSHVRYCVLPRPTPPPPFTLYVSNQSSEDPTVGITIKIDGEVIVDDDFDVEGEGPGPRVDPGHNWTSFNPTLARGDHTLHAVSSTGAEFTTEFTIREREASWAAVSYWGPDEDPQEFTFHISDEPFAFG